MFIYTKGQEEKSEATSTFDKQTAAISYIKTFLFKHLFRIDKNW